MKISRLLVKVVGIWLGLVAVVAPGAAEQFPAVVEAEVRAVIAAEQEGVLYDLDVDVGDGVGAGQVLAVVFHRDLTLKLEQEEATREYFEVLVENMTKLNEKGLVTNEELAKARMESEVNAKEIERYQSMIERSHIKAPFSGLVVSRQIQPHEWVRPGQPVIELYDPRKLRIVADIHANIAHRMKAGESHPIFFPDLDQEVPAKVAVFAPQVDVRSNTIKVYWRVDGAKGRKAGLLPGMKGVLQLGSE